MTDGFLLVSFGGPEGPDDVIPFLENATRGRGIPRERLAAVGAHYSHFGGVSPINAENREIMERVHAAFELRGMDLPILWGNRNWNPYLAEALAEASDQSITRLYAFFTTAYSSFSGCRQYRENLYDAYAEAIEVPGREQIEIVKLRAYFDHPGFIEPFVDGVISALYQLGSDPQVADEDVRPVGTSTTTAPIGGDDENLPPAGTRLVFSTHSIPTAAADSSGEPANRGAYLAQHRAVAALICQRVNERLGTDYEWDLVYQSRSGAPHIPWLEPDISDHLAELHARGVPAVVIIPIGFVSDHMEVAWDLDTVAMRDARDLGLPALRVATPGTDQRFIDMIVDLVDEARTGREPTCLTALGPRPVPCMADCCPNPREPRPALCGSD